MAKIEHPNKPLTEAGSIKSVTKALETVAKENGDPAPEYTILSQGPNAIIIYKDKVITTGPAFQDLSENKPH